MAAVDENEQKWFYLDPQQKEQGPFRSEQMTLWFNQKYFDASLPVRGSNESYFVSLGQRFGHNDRGVCGSCRLL